MKNEQTNSQRINFRALVNDPRNIHGLRYYAIRNRIKNGASVEQALALPLYPNRHGETIAALERDPRNVHGLSKQAIRSRIRRGMSIEETLSTPRARRADGMGAYSLARSPQNVHSLSEVAIAKRLERGLTPEEALSMPRLHGTLEQAVEAWRCQRSAERTEAWDNFARSVRESEEGGNND